MNFRLDEHGRTSKPPPTKEEDGSSDEDPKNVATLEYESNTILTSLAPSLSPFPSSNEEEESTRRRRTTTTTHQQWLDDLLFDCQISDSGLMPRTFWVPATGMKPRCQLEQLALDIFHHHVPSTMDYDVSCSGAEWWAQIRPSPEGTGRYSMHDDQPDELSRTGISFHWDKDEDLRLLTGGTTYIHPHLSTVTYLTDLGAPTIALNHRVHNLTGEWISPHAVEGFVSWPYTGKHLSFDGRYLHAAPMDLMEPGVWEKQQELPPISSDVDIETHERQLKLLKRRHRRVTFLVNVWLNYKPFDIQPFPDTMIDKMSGKDEGTRQRLEFATTDNTTNHQRMSSSDATQPQHQTFTWPMGDCDSKEFIEAHMPVTAIRQQAPAGGNLRIQWDPSQEAGYTGVRLFVETSNTHAENGDSEELSLKREAGIELDIIGDVKRPKLTESND